jgi:hypothetical protein
MKYCDTTTGNQVANGENKPYPKHKRIALLTAEHAIGRFLTWNISRACRVMAVVLLLNE